MYEYDRRTETRIAANVGRLEVDVSVYQANIKVDVEYFLPGIVEMSQGLLTQFVQQAPGQVAKVRQAAIRLPGFDVGIRDERGGDFTASGPVLTYTSTIYVDLSVERSELSGPTGDRFLQSFSQAVQALGGTVTNKGRRVS